MAKILTKNGKVVKTTDDKTIIGEAVTPTVGYSVTLNQSMRSAPGICFYSCDEGNTWNDLHNSISPLTEVVQIQFKTMCKGSTAGWIYTVISGEEVSLTSEDTQTRISQNYILANDIDRLSFGWNIA